MTLIEQLRQPVSHKQCEDCWYSCPKSGECCNDDAGTDCTCGADAENAMRQEAADALARAEGGAIELLRLWQKRLDYSDPHGDKPKVDAWLSAAQPRSTEEE